MKTKPLLIAVCTLAVGAGLASWLADRPGTASSNRPAMVGQKLVSAETLQSVREIQLLDEGGKTAVRLVKEGEAWTLPDYFGLPVDFDKLSRFSRSLLEGEVERHVTDNPDSLERLELGQKGVRLLSESGDSWEIEIGDRGPSGGQFIRFNQEASAYLTPAWLSIDTTSNNWAVKRPLTFEETDVARVELSVDGELLAFARPTATDDFTGENFPENWKAKSSDVARLVRTLINARFTEAVAPDHPDAAAAREASRSVTLQLFNGSKYTLNIGRRPTEPANIAEAAPESETAEAAPAPAAKTISATAVFDQDGNAVSPETIAQLTNADEGSAAPEGNAEEPAEEEPKPGPVFIFYESDASDFSGPAAVESAALQFSEHLFNQLPTARDALVEVEKSEPAPSDE